MFIAQLNSNKLKLKFMLQKKGTLLLVLVSFAFNSWAITPPSAVLKAFKTQFPDAQNCAWEKEAKGVYEVEFKNANIKMSVVYDEKGIWQETETAVVAEQVPANVLTAFKNKFPGKDIVGIDKIIDSKGVTHFEFEYKNGLRIKEVLFDLEGTLLP